MESELRVEADEDTAPATKGDICRLENVMEQLVKRAPSFPTSQTETTQLDTSLKHKRKLLELMKNKDQAFDFSNAKVTAEQIYAFATLEADVLKEMTQYLIVSTMRKKEVTSAETLVKFALDPDGPFNESSDDCTETGRRVPSLFKFGLSRSLRSRPLPPHAPQLTARTLPVRVGFRPLQVVRKHNGKLAYAGMPEADREMPELINQALAPVCGHLHASLLLTPPRCHRPPLGSSRTASSWTTRSW